MGALFNRTEDDEYPEELDKMSEEDPSTSLLRRLEAKQKDFAKMDSFKTYQVVLADSVKGKVLESTVRGRRPRPELEGVQEGQLRGRRLCGGNYVNDLEGHRFPRSGEWLELLHRRWKECILAGTGS